MASPRDAGSVARVLAVCLVVATLPGTTPVGAVDFDADGPPGGIDDGTAVSDGAPDAILDVDASGRLGAPIHEDPLAPLFHQEDDDDDEADEEEDDDAEEDDDGEDDAEEDEEDDDDDEADEEDEDGDHEGDGAADDDEEDEDDEDAPEGDGEDDPIASVVSELSGDSNDDRSGDGGNEDRSDGSDDDAQEGGSESGGVADDGSEAGADEQVDEGAGSEPEGSERGGSESAASSASPDVGVEAVNAAQAETPTQTPAVTTEASAQEGFRVENVSVNRSTVTAGRAVRITATVVNGWSTTETRDVHLVMFDETVDVSSVTVPAEGARQVTFVRAIQAPGTYEVSVGQASTEVTVTAAEGDASTDRQTGLAGTTHVETPGFTGLAAVLGVLGALLVVTVRRRG